MKHLLQQCLEVLESIPDFMVFSGSEKIEPAIKAIKEALAKDEQLTTRPLREPFIVKQYDVDDRPIIKGNGFDGLEIGTDREDAQDFIDFVNSKMFSLQKDEQAPFAYFRRNKEWDCWEQVISDATGEKGVIAAYTRPAQRQPLSEEEIDELIDITIAEQGHMHDWDMYKFASVIENAVYEKMGIK